MVRSRRVEWVRVAQCAEMLSVSTATIRNWIKAGHLVRNESGEISKRSIDRVVAEVIGAEKLTSRSNKLYKTEMQSVVVDLDNWESYESQLPESRRNREGIYYTPQYIVDDMLATIDVESLNLEKATFCDPCCGCGNFLVAALKLGFAPQNIYGYDCDPNGVAIATRRLAELSEVEYLNVECADFLSIEGDREFDFIYTNPPWGKKSCQSQRSDSSELFFRAALSRLREGGRMGFLMQEAVFNIRTYTNFRALISSLDIKRFIHYGRPFKGLLTAAQAVVVDKRSGTDAPIECVSDGVSFLRSRDSFATNPYNIFNFRVEPSAAEVIKHLLQSPNQITLKGGAEWGIGIVTGDNRRFCCSEPKEGYRPIIRGGDITYDGLREPSTYITSDLSQCQQVAKISLFDAPSKIVYKFISSRLIFGVDREQHLILNSANMMVLNPHFPLTEEELVALFNTPFMSWLHASIFGTAKVLRRDLEQLPIFADYFDGRAFDESEYLHFIGVERVDNGYQLVREH